MTTYLNAYQGFTRLQMGCTIKIKINTGLHGSHRCAFGKRWTKSEEVDKVQALRTLRVSSDEVGIGRCTLVLVRHGTRYHLTVLLSHDVSSPLRSSVLKPNLHKTSL